MTPVILPFTARQPTPVGLKVIRTGEATVISRQWAPGGRGAVPALQGGRVLRR